MNMREKKFNLKEGALMVESIVAVSLIVVGLLGVFALLIKSSRMNKDVYNRFVASYLAAEGIEVIKNIIDTDVATPSVPWNKTIESTSYKVQHDSMKDSITNLYGASSTELLAIDKSTGLFSYSGSETPFKRTIRTNDNGDFINVSSIVEWEIDGKKQVVNFEDRFTRWRDDGL